MFHSRHPGLSFVSLVTCFALAAAHMAPALTGQVYVPAEAKGSGGGLGLALLAAGVVWAVG